MMDEKIARGAATAEERRQNTEVGKMLLQFYVEAPKVFSKYMRMDQRLIATPADWIAKRV